MMDAWQRVYKRVFAAIESLETATPWFRGHSDVRWRLLPSIARCRPTQKAERSYPSNQSREEGVYHHFVTESGSLLPAHEDAWSAAFAMQHHGLPTRLL